MNFQEVADRVKEVQVILTRGCDIQCGHCKLTRKGPMDDELDLEQWKQGFSNLQNRGFETVKIMGGEPTSKKWLPDLIKYVRDNTSLDVAVLTNGHFSDKYGIQLAEAGLMGIFASVDGIEQMTLSIGQDAIDKATSGYRILKKAKEWGIPLRASNTVFNKQNIRQMPGIVQRLSDEGIYVNLCSVIWSPDTDREYSGPISDEYKFTQDDKKLIDDTMGQLIEMKDQGALISVPKSNLENMSRFGINCDWQCDDFVQSRVDADGGLTLCNEYRTRLTDKHNILKLTDNKSYIGFVKDWYDVREETECSGCYWSCFLQAQSNIANGRLEFDYARDAGIIPTRKN